MKKPASSEPISATLVAENKRMIFLPRFFGIRYMLHGEQAVYNRMRSLCANYDGGHWHFYKLSNGGSYMAPNRQAPMHVVVDGNGFDGQLSADAAGIVATIFTLDILANRTEQYRFVDLNDKLKDYALSHHAEAHLIYRAIDNT